MENCKTGDLLCINQKTKKITSEEGELIFTIHKKVPEKRVNSF